MGGFRVIFILLWRVILVIYLILQYILCMFDVQKVRFSDFIKRGS